MLVKIDCQLSMDHNRSLGSWAAQMNIPLTRGDARNRLIVSLTL